MNTPDRRTAGNASSARTVSILALICFLLASCTSTRHVSPPVYAGLEPANNRYLEVSTDYGDYRVADFAFTDSTFVIKRLLEASYPMAPSKTQPPSHLPCSMPLQSVQSVTEVRNSWSATEVIIGVGVAGAVVGLVLLLFHGWEQSVIDAVFSGN